MANRILRDWTDSENIDKLSFHAEVFFTRLFMKADDYGCFHANPKLLKAALFPLKDIRETDISRWTAECSSAGLIALYEVDEKRYMEIINFGQRLRTMNRRFPENDSNARSIVSDPRSNDSNPPPETETKRNKKLKQETETEETEFPFEDFWESYDKKVGDKKKLEKKWINLSEIDRENAMRYISGYIDATPDKKYRKNPETFLNGKSWNDEIINNKQSESLPQQKVNGITHILSTTESNSPWLKQD